MADAKSGDLLIPCCASSWTKMMAENILGLTFKAVVDVPQPCQLQDQDQQVDRSRFGYWQVFKYVFADHSLANLDDSTSTSSVFESLLNNYLYTTDKETCDLLLETWKKDLKGHTGTTTTSSMSSGRPTVTERSEGRLKLNDNVNVNVPDSDDVAALPAPLHCLALDLVKEKMILYKVGRDVRRKYQAVLNARVQYNGKEKFERLGKISKYLISLYRLVDLTSEGHNPSGRSFERLFIEYAEIFDVVFRSGDVPGRSMMVYGQRVSSIPDLRFDKEFDKPWMIVTCSEVKKAAKVPGDLDKKPDCYDDVDLSDALLGQHAVELLLELPFSAMKVCGKKDRNCVLGLIVQATKVRLTCLDMNQESIDHLQQCSLNDFTYQYSKKKRGTFYFTRAYDMLNEDDFKHIACILLTLGHVANYYP